MTGPKPPRNLTPPMCAQLQKEMIAACRAVAEAHGLAVEDGGVQEMDLRSSFAFNVRVGIPRANGAWNLPAEGGPLWDCFRNLPGMEERRRGA